jgi:PAS domain S-box-containing protein
MKNDPSTAILEHAPFGLIVTSPKGLIDDINPKAAAIFGESELEKLIGRDLFSYVQARDMQRFQEYLQKMDAEGYYPGWRTFYFKDVHDNPFRILIFGQPNFNKNEPGINLYFLKSNVDFRGTDQENLPTIDILGSKYWSIFEYALIGVAVFDEKLNIDEVNRSFANYFNLDRESVQGQHYNQVFNHQTSQAIHNLMNEMVSNAKDFGKNVVTLLTEDGEPSVLEFSLAIMPKDVHGKNMIVMIVEDITNQRDTHQALIQSEKLALTGRLAASLAHEINNPLQTSIGCLGLAEEMLLDDDRDLRVYIQMAIDELQRSARIVKKLRDLNRPTANSEKIPVDLKKVLDSVLILTKKRLSDRDIVPVFPFEGRRPYVLASTDQIQQVFLNLVMNAIDALPKGGNIYLDIIKTEEPEGQKVVVRDTGVGISEENLVNLFNPFFTTKEEGLGLGLFISKSIIEDHNGTMTVESKQGVGTAFTVWLPGLQ